ncbi:MAG TPA: PspC domain-containing protein [Jatrophihabitans sp.]|nr:PspC domain-containing protein [Jatrophihabitans sp.]
MPTSDTRDDMTPPAPAPRPRRLRRVREGRIGAGVAAGLGEYFGLDPVLFRVLFATSAFFGGAGIIAYLIAWAAIPDESTEHAAVDGWFDALRARRVPLWVMAVVGGLLLWLVAFSWWAPGRFLPVLAVIVLVLFFLARREPALTPPSAAPTEPPPTAPAPVDLRKHPAEAAGPAAPTAPYPPGRPVPYWIGEGRSWFDEARAAGRARRQRAYPVRVATLTALVVTLAGLAIADAVTGIAMQVYFWAGLAILVVGLLAGLVLRRAPVSLGVLAIPFAICAIAFAGNSASLHDGIGQRDWKPTGAPAAEYRLGIGKAVLDLRAMDRPTKPAHIDVTVGAGQAVVILPKSLNAKVHADIHFGHLDADDSSSDDVEGVGVSQTIEPLAAATGQLVTVDVHLADGNVTVDRR